MSTGSHPDQSPARRGGGVSPPPPEGGPTPACQHPHTLATCSLEGHLLFSFAVLLYQEGIFVPRLNMTFDKDVFVVPSQDILGACCWKGNLNMGVAPRPKGAARNQRVGAGRKRNLSSRTESKGLPNTRLYSLSMKPNFCDAGDFQGYFITDTLSCFQISHKQAAFWTLGLWGMSRGPAESDTGGWIQISVDKMVLAAGLDARFPYLLAHLGGG